MKQAHYVLRYREYMVEMYGERSVKAMEKLAWKPAKKFDRNEVVELQKELRKKIKNEENRIGGYQ